MQGHAFDACSLLVTGAEKDGLVMLPFVHGEFVELLYAGVHFQYFGQSASEIPVVNVRSFGDRGVKGVNDLELP